MGANVQTMQEKKQLNDLMSMSTFHIEGETG